MAPACSGMGPPRSRGNSIKFCMQEPPPRCSARPPLWRRRTAAWLALGEAAADPPLMRLDPVLALVVIVQHADLAVRVLDRLEGLLVLLIGLPRAPLPRDGLPRRAGVRHIRVRARPSAVHHPRCVFHPCARSRCPAAGDPYCPAASIAPTPTPIALMSLVDLTPGCPRADPRSIRLGGWGLGAVATLGHEISTAAEGLLRDQMDQVRGH
jgi:hypothetical protein